MTGFTKERIFFETLFFLIVLLECILCLPPLKPNIVLIMVDDLGWNDVSFHGSKQIPTPNIDALAKDGIILQNYYVSPMCSPSRGSIMTGKHPVNIGMQHLVILADEPWGLPLTEKILPQHMKDLGYATHGVGKWHLGYFKEEYLPMKRGFDSFYGYWTGVEDYYTHFSDKGNKSGLDLHDNFVNDWGQNGTYGTDLFSMKAKNVILNHDQSKPLFLFLAQQAVHSGNFKNPLQAPEKYVEKFSHLMDKNRKIYAGMVAALDICVGEIFSALAKSGMLDNTIIVFTTDNGGAVQGADGIAGSNWPLRGSKYNLWEGGVRGVSFLWSAHLRQVSRVSHHLMHVSDWLPTLYAAAGGDIWKLGHIDGVNLWPSLVHDFPSPRFEILHNIDPVWKVEGIRMHKYKLIKGSAYDGKFDVWYDQNGKEDFTDEHEESPETQKLYNKVYRRMLKQSKVARILLRKYRKPLWLTGQCWGDCWKHLVVNCGPKPVDVIENCQPNKAPCLFDVVQDPCEYHNIAPQFPEVVQELKYALDNYRAKSLSPKNKPADHEMEPQKLGYAWIPWKE